MVVLNEYCWDYKVMLIGKSHKVIPILKPVYGATSHAYNLAVQNCQSSTVMNAIEVRVAIENILYEIDKIAFEDAQTSS